jgi:very-short-patch-repair endonuclease
MRRVFIGSEALRKGRVSPHGLRTLYQRVYPDVYAPKGLGLNLADRAEAAWLWSHREGVIAGATASGLYGADFVNDTDPIELVWPNHRAPAGIKTRHDLVLPGEVGTVAGLPVTTPERTAFDLARRGAVWQAVARLDAHVRAIEYKDADVTDMCRHHPHARWIRRVEQVLAHVDAGAESPKESWLRIVLVEGGYPRPQTQIPVPGPYGEPLYRLDMGWPELMIAVEYDGEQHRTDPGRYRRDIKRSEYLQRTGWTSLRVVAGDQRHEVLWRLRQIWPR